MPDRPRNAKKDDAPRGVFCPDPRTWAIRFTCAAGHVHEETIGPFKTEAVRAHSARRARALAELGWCPRVERARERARTQAAEGWRKTERFTAARLVTALGNRSHEEITTAEVERVLDGLLTGRTGATRNRYRDLLSGMFNRAHRLGLVQGNPVTRIPKLREAGGRLAYLGPDDEAALRYALPEHPRQAFVVALHSGLR